MTKNFFLKKNALNTFKKEPGFCFLFKTLIILFFFFHLTACEHDKNLSNAKDYVAELKRKHADAIEPIPKINLKPVAKYAMERHKDPFERIVKQNLSNNMAPDLTRRKEPLENYSLDSLKMVGIIRSANQIWAILLTPDGLVYQVTVGNYIGQNYGRISKINEEQINLTEKVNLDGAWQAKETKLVLTPEEEVNRKNSLPSSEKK